ncbi:MAG: RNA methyltransferase [Clostridia bacterium]|nr:RNA methyltransferase [Clostridia bacterium]
MKVFESIRNPEIQALRKLAKARERRESGRYLVEGPRMAEEALASGVLEAVYLSRDTERNTAVARAAEDAGIGVAAVSDAVMESLCETKTPQGIICLCRIVQDNALPSGNLILAMDAVQNPGNVGTMIRTADAAGFSGCILGAGCADLYGPKTLAAAMGSVFHVRIAAVQNLADCLAKYRAENYAVIASELGGADFYDGCPSGPAVLVIGNEGNGISEAVSAAATHHLKLPMRGGAESLNASVAAGIMIYEMARRDRP